ncbi:unnamed protein product, partial [Mesorhabditis spiculigera]
MMDSTLSIGAGMTSNASSTNSLITGNSQNQLGSSSGPWRMKLSNIKNSIMGTPRFHRRKMSNGQESDTEDSQILDTTDLVKKSWFGSLTSSMSVEREDTHCVPVQGRTLNGIKAELIRAFLTIHELSHSVVGQNSFRVEYKRGPTYGGSVFSRGVKMNVDIINSTQQLPGEAPMYVVQFSLLAGPVRRFKRLVEHLTSVLQNATQQRSDRQAATQMMVRPRRLSDSSDKIESAIHAEPGNNYSRHSMKSVGSKNDYTKSPGPQRRNTSAVIIQPRQGVSRFASNPVPALMQCGTSNSKTSLDHTAPLDPSVSPRPLPHPHSFTHSEPTTPKCLNFSTPNPYTGRSNLSIMGPPENV